MKKQKGITLIALIITIIVMLILVAVTINVALNGGLFGKAKDASDQTGLAINREELQSLIISKMDVATSKIPSELGTITTDGKTWTVTAEEQGEDIIVILTDTEDETNTKTYNLEDDLKIFGITVTWANGSVFNNYGVTYKFFDDEHIDYIKIEKSGEKTYVYKLHTYLSRSNGEVVGWVNDGIEHYECTPVDYTEMIEDNGMAIEDWLYALDGFTYLEDESPRMIFFSPDYNTFNDLTTAYDTIDTTFDWSVYEQ